MSGIQNIRDGLTGNVTKVIVVAIIITFIGSVGGQGFSHKAMSMLLPKLDLKR